MTFCLFHSQDVTLGNLVAKFQKIFSEDEGASLAKGDPESITVDRRFTRNFPDSGMSIYYFSIYRFNQVGSIYKGLLASFKLFLRNESCSEEAFVSSIFNRVKSFRPKQYCKLPNGFILKVTFYLFLFIA